MAHIVIKTARDRDQYLIWSTNVDAPIAGPGTREQTVGWLVDEDRYRLGEAEQTLARADTNGSSDRAIKFGWWDDDPIAVVHGAPDDGWYHLPRGRLAAYADALAADDDGAAVALLECWQRHGEDDS